MRKITTILFVPLMLIGGLVQAQSHLSNNMLAPSGEGYQFDFKGTAIQNCLNNIKYNQWYMPDAYVVESVGNDTLVVSTDGTQEDWHRLNLRLYDGGCNDQVTVDLTDHQDFEMVLHSNASVQCMITFSTMDEAQANFNPIVYDMVPGLNTITADDLDFRTGDGSTFLDSSAVGIISLYFRNAWDDYAAAGTFKIAHIRVGDSEGLSFELEDDTPTSIEEAQINASLRVYPNPAEEHVTVSFEADSPGSISLVDITGKQQQRVDFSAGNTHANINTQELAQGVYLVHITTGSAVVTRRIVVR